MVVSPAELYLRRPRPKACPAVAIVEGLLVWQAPATESDALCSLTPELEEGPYYLNETLLRRNITEDQAGVPLTLRVKLVIT